MVFPFVLLERESEREGGGSGAWTDDATRPETLTALNMLQPLLRCPSSAVIFVFVFFSPPPAHGQDAPGGGGGTERIQVTFTPTICKVRCGHDRCVNYCERGNVTTLYSGDARAAGGRREAPQGPGFRVCESDL